MRGQVRGPFAVWLRNVELAEHTLALQDLFASRVLAEHGHAAVVAMTLNAFDVQVPGEKKPLD